MFIASKIVWFLLSPEVLIFTSLVVGGVLLWTRWFLVGRAVTSVAVIIVVLVTVFPVGTWLFYILESRFPPIMPPSSIDGIVVLGGSSRQSLTAERGQVALKESAERLTTFVTLARRYPDARLVFVGGSSSLTRPDLTEAADARQIFSELGLDVGRVHYETRSRNTYENALLSLAIAKPLGGEKWLLITSAFHMPRAVGCFRRVGWDITPYPVDYRTSTNIRVIGGLSVGSSIKRLTHAAHEWVGLVAYYIMGRTNAFLPLPRA